MRKQTRAEDRRWKLWDHGGRAKNFEEICSGGSAPTRKKAGSGGRAGGAAAPLVRLFWAGYPLAPGREIRQILGN